MKKHCKDEKEIVDLTETPVFMHSCISCDYKTNVFDNLRDHIFTNHKQKVGNVKTDDQCFKCGKSVKTELGKARHAELYCTECEVCLPERISFDIHMGVEHRDSGKHNEEMKKLRCKFCNKTFKHLVEVEWHEETEHDDDDTTKPSKAKKEDMKNKFKFICGQCGIYSSAKRS